MKEQKKKRIIVLLLFISCIISGYILWEVSDGSPAKLKSFAQADSLIERELQNFSISDRQIQRTSTKVSSKYTRKIYRVSLPEGFAKTQLHAALNRTFYPLGVATPSRVTFPDRNMKIHLFYNEGVFRTIELKTDPELNLNRSHGSIMVAFNTPPSDDLLDTIASFGEPIPIILSINQPMQANELLKSFSGRYDRLLFWLQDGNSEDLLQNNPQTARRRLAQFEKVLPNAHLLLVHQGGTSPNKSKQIAAQTDLTFIDARQALRLHENLGKAAFFEELNKLTSSQSPSLAIVTGNKTTLTWLEQKLPELKRAGVQLTPPPEINF